MMDDFDRLLALEEQETARYERNYSIFKDSLSERINELIPYLEEFSGINDEATITDTLEFLNDYLNEIL